jgi:hypothetical protein
MSHPQCHICQHPRRAEIEAELDQGRSYMRIVLSHGGFSPMSLTRHQRHRHQTGLTVVSRRHLHSLRSP